MMKSDLRLHIIALLFYFVDLLFSGGKGMLLLLLCLRLKE